MPIDITNPSVRIALARHLLASCDHTDPTDAIQTIHDLASVLDVEPGSALLSSDDVWITYDEHGEITAVSHETHPTHNID